MSSRRAHRPRFLGWLIRRHVDPEAEVVVAGPDECPPTPPRSTCAALITDTTEHEWPSPFNIGIEIGQLAAIAVMAGLLYLVTRFIATKKHARAAPARVRADLSSAAPSLPA